MSCASSLCLHFLFHHVGVHEWAPGGPPAMTRTRYPHVEESWGHPLVTYPKTNIFHLSPPYLPIHGIPLPLLKYIIYVLSLDVQNLLFCASDSAHEEVVRNP